MKEIKSNGELERLKCNKLGLNLTISSKILPLTCCIATLILTSTAIQILILSTSLQDQFAISVITGGLRNVHAMLAPLGDSGLGDNDNLTGSGGNTSVPSTSFGTVPVGPNAFLVEPQPERPRELECVGENCRSGQIAPDDTSGTEIEEQQESPEAESLQ